MDTVFGNRENAPLGMNFRALSKSQASPRIMLSLSMRHEATMPSGSELSADRARSSAGHAGVPDRQSEYVLSESFDAVKKIVLMTDKVNEF